MFLETRNGEMVELVRRASSLPRATIAHAQFVYTRALLAEVSGSPSFAIFSTVPPFVLLSQSHGVLSPSLSSAVTLFLSPRRFRSPSFTYYSAVK